MSRTPVIKELTNTRLANGYGGWIYCENCNKTIGYLCYVTYKLFKLKYACKCGGCGNVSLAFAEESSPSESQSQLIALKNRLCCPNGQSPLFTLLTKNLNYYNYENVCNTCNTKFVKEQIL